MAERFATHLAPNTVNFRRMSWEQIYDLPVVQSAGGKLREYFETKTRRLKKAFEIEPLS